MEYFQCDGDPTGVGLRWEKWKRGLGIYLEAASIYQPAKKRATLLHMGDLALQEIYYNIPGAHVSNVDPNVDVYQTALSKLNEYFAPKQSKIYERYVFMLMKQKQDERFAKFLVRLSKQADKCEFQEKEEYIIDQITDKCSSIELRKKILKAGDSITLDLIIVDADTLESVKRQLEDFGNKNLQNTPTTNKINTYEKYSNS